MESFKSPQNKKKPKNKDYHSIGKLKSKRIVLPPLQECPTGETKYKKSLFSKNNNTVKDTKIKINYKLSADFNEYTTPNKFKLRASEKRVSRIGIENSYSLDKKKKSNICIISPEDSMTKLNNPRRFSSHKKVNRLKLHEVMKTDDIKKYQTTSKFPMICTNLSEKQKLNNNNINQITHKFQSKKKLILNYDFQSLDYETQTRTGEESGIKKENNQDASIILKHVCDIEDYDIYGIMDGHGSNGHLVSNFVMNKIKEYFNNPKIYKLNMQNKEKLETKMNYCYEIYEKLKHNNYELIKKFHKKTNDELYDQKFDVHFSGTTCVLVFKLGKKIICSNVGDSRAILVERNFSFDEKTNEIMNKYDVIELSHDHKPNNKKERERIEKMGGEVEQEFENEKDEKSNLPFRVWKKGCDYPGLSLSRSLGDKIAEEIGVISEPDFIEAEINKNSKYIIMGSDGLFEYLSNNDIIEISKKYLNNDNLQLACDIIVENEVTLFKQKENRVDDVTINIINI